MRKLSIAVVTLIFLSFLAHAQTQSSSATTESTVPRLVNFSGTATDVNGKPLTGIVGITFSIYQDQQGGTPLWFEIQNVSPNLSGRFTVTLGTTKSGGLPMQLFTSGEARWLGVQIQDQPEQPRVLLLSVPYALKAADAETIGGLPASAFVLAAPPNGGSMTSSTSPQNSPTQPNLGGSGTQNYIPLWTDSSGDLGNSIVYQSGTTAVGIGTTTPAAMLDVNGPVISRGTLQLPSMGTANATQGYNSQPFSLQGSAFNSNTGKAIGPLFQWQTEPVGNNTSNPAGSLNLLYGNGSGKPSETGLNIASTGLITFAKNQTFPGAGTITGVTAGTGLSGGGTSGNVTLKINTTFANQYYAQLKAPNTFSANQTVNANLSAIQLISSAAQGTAPLQVTSTTQVPNLNASLLGGLPASAFQTAGNYATLGANIFTGNQTVNGNVSATGLLTGSAFNIGSNIFDWGSYAIGTAFMGFAGNTTTTGYQNTGSGYQALYSNSSGSDNTATGYAAMNVNTTGSDNTAVGAFSLTDNSSGANNTAIGFQALYQNTTGSANTASGIAALGNNTTGTGNTANGTFALSQNTTGIANTATGEGTLQTNSTGASNTAVGSNALFFNTTGSDNTASGSIALYQNTTGYYNTAGGLAALANNTTGWANTATGASSLWGNTTGGNNTAAGYNAMMYNTTGSNDTALGYDSGTDQSFTGLNNATAIGAFADVTENNAVVLGSILNVNNCTPQNNCASTNVGIGTTAPQYALDVHGTGNFTGLVTFASNQQFPGAGTITGVSAGTDLLGGGTSGNVTLGVDTTKVVTGVVAGTDLTGGGTGGVQTLNLDTTKVPQLNAANTFTGNQMVNGNLSATGAVSGGSYQIGSNLFAYGSYGYANAFLGFAGNTSMTGTGNTATGYQAFYSNTTGGDNTASGYQALLFNTTGALNTASGFQALKLNTTGNDNTGSGSLALYYNTGSYNTATGASALSHNGVASDNVAVGFQSLFSNAGDTAGDGWYNTAVGVSALYSNNDTSGSGYHATGNTAMGYAALYFNTTGSFNSASGSQGLYFNTTGGGNTANGNTALFSNTTGNQNTASGQAALYYNTTGYENTASGYGALEDNTIGYENTAVGGSALAGNTWGWDLTCVGYGCVGADGLTNATAIGAHAVVGQSNSLVLGGTGEWGVKVGIGTDKPSNILTIGRGLGHPVSDSWETYSSRRWKSNIQTLNGALAKVEQLRGVSYDLKDSGKHEIGVIAEEVGAVVPEVVSYEKNGTDASGVDYGRLTALLIEATKEQQALIRAQQLQIKTQQVQIKRQAAQIAHLSLQVETIRTAIAASHRTASQVRRVNAQNVRQ